MESYFFFYLLQRKESNLSWDTVSTLSSICILIHFVNEMHYMAFAFAPKACLSTVACLLSVYEVVWELKFVCLFIV